MVLRISPLPFKSDSTPAVHFLPNPMYFDEDMSPPDLNPHISNVEMSEAEGPSTSPWSSPPDQKSTKVDNKKLTELNREIGCYLRRVHSLCPRQTFPSHILGM